MGQLLVYFPIILECPENNNLHSGLQRIYRTVFRGDLVDGLTLDELRGIFALLVSLCVGLAVCLSDFVFVWLCIFVCLSDFVFVCLSDSVSVSLYVRLTLCLSACMFV